MTDNQFHGSVQMSDGTRRTLSADEAETLWNAVEASDARRKEMMPDQESALSVLMNAYTRLRDFGWENIIYCPKDGSSFDVIEAGSTGIFRCHYEGEWPTGSWWLEEDGGSPSRPILFRLDPEAAEAKRLKMKEAAERYRVDAHLSSARDQSRGE